MSADRYKNRKKRHYPKGLVQELFGDDAKFASLTRAQRRIYNNENKRRHWAAHPEKRIATRAAHAARLRERRATDPEMAKRRAEYMRTYRYKGKRNPKKPAVNRRQWLKAKYGLTHDQYEEMLAAQGGKCATCDRTRSDQLNRSLAVDHDHQTGVVRALLCARCNLVLGLVGESQEFLRVLAQYLELHSMAKAA